MKIKGGMVMLNKNIKKKISKFVGKVGTAAAKNDANQSCLVFLYQPKQPKSLKKTTRDFKD